MAKRFYIQKDVEYKQGKVDTWYMIKLETEEGTQLVDLCRDDEEKANELLKMAVSAWVPNSKSIIKEVIVEQ
jgi:hypothetical protein